MEAEMGGTWNTDKGTRITYKISSENVIAHDRPQPIWEEDTEVDQNRLLNWTEISEDGIQW
jgi:hypothetical protein